MDSDNIAIDMCVSVRMKAVLWTIVNVHLYIDIIYLFLKMCRLYFETDLNMYINILFTYFFVNS